MLETSLEPKTINQIPIIKAILDRGDFPFRHDNLWFKCAHWVTTGHSELVTYSEPLTLKAAVPEVPEYITIKSCTYGQPQWPNDNKNRQIHLISFLFTFSNWTYQHETLQVLPRPWTVCFSWHITSRAAVQMLTFYSQLHGDKRTDESRLLDAYGTGKRSDCLRSSGWPPVVSMWNPTLWSVRDLSLSVLQKKSVYSSFSLLETSDTLPFKSAWPALLHFQTGYLRYIFSLI